MSVTIRVFDPPMCCSTGVCGPSVDPELVRFAADVDWLEKQGVKVERFNLAQQPGAFASVASSSSASGPSTGLVSGGGGGAVMGAQTSFFARAAILGVLR